jgi:hypothetical protein
VCLRACVCVCVCVCVRARGYIRPSAGECMRVRACVGMGVDVGYARGSVLVHV